MLLIDQEGCLSNMEQGFYSKWKDIYPEEFCIPPQERTTHMIVDEYPSNLKTKVKSIYHAEGFFSSLDPMPGAVKALREMERLGIDFRICTSPLHHYQNCLVEKYDWIERHFGFEVTKRMILTQDKTLIRGQYLIDDKPEIQGTYQPEWEHILFDAPYNRDILGRKRIDWSSWERVLGF